MNALWLTQRAWGEAGMDIWASWWLCNGWMMRANPKARVSYAHPKLAH